MGKVISILSADPNSFYPDGGGVLDTTKIVYKLSRDSRIWIKIFTYQDVFVQTLVSAQQLDAGLHEHVWDGLDDEGERLPAGIYKVTVTAHVGGNYYIDTYCIMLMSHMTEYPFNPVYAPVNQQAQYPCVLFDKDGFNIPGGSPYLMWYDSPELPLLIPRINMASSNDGINWTDEGTVSGLTNPSRCFVLYQPNPGVIKFRMWYWNTAINDDITAIRYAESSDGINWINDQPVSQHSVLRLVSGTPGTWNPYTFGPRFVMYTPDAPNAGIYPENHTYAMYYNASPDLEKQYTALAYSSDGLNWHVARNVPVLTGTDFGGEELIDMQYTWDEYSVVLNSMARTPMGLWVTLYSAGDDITGIHKGIGFAMSRTGLFWVKGSFSHPLMHINDSVAWRDTKTFTPFMVADRDKFSGFGEAVRVKVWFTGSEETENGHIEEKYGIGYTVLTAEVTP